MSTSKGDKRAHGWRIGHQGNKIVLVLSLKTDRRTWFRSYQVRHFLLEHRTIFSHLDALRIKAFYHGDDETLASMTMYNRNNELGNLSTPSPTRLGILTIKTGTFEKRNNNTRIRDLFFPMSLFFLSLLFRFSIFFFFLVLPPLTALIISIIVHMDFVQRNLHNIYI